MQGLGPNPKNKSTILYCGYEILDMSYYSHSMKDNSICPQIPGAKEAKRLTI